MGYHKAGGGDSRAPPTDSVAGSASEDMAGRKKIDVVEEFLRSLSVERRCSPHTIRAYRRELERLERALREEAPERPPDWTSVTTDQLRGFLARRSDDVGNRSLGRTVSAVRSFFSHMRRAGHRSDNPASELGVPKFPRELPRYLSEKDLSRIFESTDSSDEFETRDLVLLELLYGSGLRACLLYTSPSPRDKRQSRMPSSA